MSSDPPALHRRAALAKLSAMASLAICSGGDASRGAEPERRTAMGLVIYDCSLRRQWRRRRDGEPDLFEPLEFLRHCHQLGAGGMQVALGDLDVARAGQIRGFAEQHRLFVDAIIRPPRDQQDTSRFEAEVRTAVAVGALAARTVIIPGRRYEQFESLAEFREAEARGRRMLELAVPIVEKHRLPLAVENHKDQRIDERLALLESLQSEFIGACVDTGNSFALLDDPHAAVEALAPYAFTVHLKDQAVLECEQGFLLGDIPLGQGCFDLPRMVAALRKAKPNLHFALELITRDPLKVTCLTEKYWRTMPHVPGGDLANALRIVRQHPASNLQQVSRLSLAAQVELEDTNIAASLTCAQQQLGL